MTQHSSSAGSWLRVNPRTRRKSKLYMCWSDMRIRCNNPRSKNYPWYGAKGVKVCQEWNDYAAFRAWAISTGYRKDVTLEREDSNGDYSPSNCRWATRAEQMRNISRNVMVTHDGRTMCATDWSRELGLHPSVVSQRIRAGWDPVSAVTTPRDPRSRRFVQ